jgi:hypothetical protein
MGISIKIGGGAASVPAATSSTAGKVRLATNTETVTGTATDIAVTPAGVAAALAGIVGGMTYKGFWDAINAVPDLSNAKQGDFYYVSAAGTRYGKEWAVGDHLVVNANMGGTIDGAKLDKIDSTEMVSNLGDLLDVTITSPTDGQGLVYDEATSQWVNSALVNVLDDLDDVALNALTSSSYSNSTTSAGLTNLRDHITEIGSGLTAIRTIPTSLGATNLLLVSNIGLGEVELRVAGSAVFSVAGAPSSDPITISAQTRATLTGSEVEGQVRWQVSTAALTPRQSLTRIGAANWTNGYINAYDVQGVASQGEINNIQAELNATQAGAGLASDGSYTERTSSNYINSSTSLYSADTLLDSAIKSEATTRASADTTLQNNINAEASTRASADTTLQNNINAEASTRASADSAEASTRASADSALQAELDATQVGAGLNADGSYSAPTSSYYLASATSLKNADSLLDTQLKSVADDVATLGGQLVASVNTITPVAGDVTLTATDISGFATVATSGAYSDLSGAPVLADVATSGAGVDVNIAHTAVNYTAATPDLEAHLAGIDTQLGVGLVTSVNNVEPVGGNVTLTAADLSLATVATSGLYSDLTGSPVLATVATSGLYSDLTGSPVLATVATSGLYSDLTGSPVLATVATSGAAGDVSVAATPVNYTAASPDVEAHLAGIDTVLGTLGGEIVATVNGIAPVVGDVTVTAQDIDTDHTAVNYTAAGASVTEHLAGVDTALGALASFDSTLQGEVNAIETGVGLSAAGTYVPPTSSNYINSSTSVMSALNLLDVGTHNAAILASTVYEAVPYSNTIAVNQDPIEGVTDNLLNGLADATTYNKLLVWVSPGSYSGNTVYLNRSNLRFVANGAGTGGVGITELVSRALVISGAETTRVLVQGFQVEGGVTIASTLGRHNFRDCQLVGGLTVGGMPNFASFRDCDIGGTITIGADVTGVLYFVNCDFAGATLVNNATAAQVIITNCANVPVAALASVTVVGENGLSDASYLGAYSALALPNATSFTGNASELTFDLNASDIDSTHTPVNYTAATADIDAHLAGVDTVLGTLGGEIVATVNGIAPVVGDVTVTAQDIDTNHTAVNYTAAGASVTEHLAGVDTAIGARPLTTATLLKSGNLSGLTSVSTARSNLGLGTAAVEDVGTAIGDVVQLVDVSGSAGLPAVDGSNITGLDYTNLTNVPTSFITSLEYITDQNPLTLVAGKHYIMANATDTLKVLTVPSSANGGDIIRITNWGLGRLKLTTGGSNTTFLLSGLDVVGGATAGELFVESKCTVDLVGFDYVPAGLEPAWGVYFISSIEINTKGLTTTGQAIVYNATTKKLEGGAAGDMVSGYTPTNYTIADGKFDSHFAGIDTDLGLKAATADVLLSANNLSDLADAATARTNLGLGTAATLDVGTSANNVVQLNSSAQLPAVDGSLLTNVASSVGALDDIGDVTITTPADRQVLTYDSATSEWINLTIGKPAVTSASVSGSYSITTYAGSEEIFLLTTTAATTVSLPSAATVTSGFKYHIKNLGAFTLTLDPNGAQTIDGASTFDISVQYATISIVSDGANWFVI